MSHAFTIASVNWSPEKGTAKQPVASAVVDQYGLQGDSHAGPWHRQLSLIGVENIAQLVGDTGAEIGPGELAENLTTRGIDLEQIAPLDRLRIGAVLLEVTQIGKACHGDRCEVFRRVGRCVMPKQGIFCRVLSGGTIDSGAPGVLEQRPLDIRVITLSDRASRGEYSDQSGPRVEELITEALRPRRWHVVCERTILPDDPEALDAALRQAQKAGADVVITTGGTGVGPRDMSPDVAQAVCDRLIPGIMEAIRVKHGASNPRALLSRGIAGVAGQTLIYTLPGSVRAVQEYVPDILLTLEHLLLMVHGLDAH